MITRNMLLLVSLCLWEGLVVGALASKIVRRRGVGGSYMMKLGESRAVDQWDVNADANAMPLRNLISHEQAGDTGSFYYSKILQNHAAPSVANKEMKAFKPKREVDSVSKKEASPRILLSNKELNRDVKNVKNNTKNAETLSKTGRTEKTFTIHHKPDLHPNKTRFKSGSRSRSRPDLSATGVGFNTDPTRKLNLTGSYGVLKLLSKENLVRIVNSQMQSISSLSFPSKGSRSRKRDLIDVNHRQLEAQKVPRQDMAVTLSHNGFDNQTEFPYVSPVTTLDLTPDQGADTHIHQLSEVNSALGKGQDNLETQGSNSSDNKNKHLVHVLSTPRSEVSLSPEKEAMISRTEPPFTSTKHLPLYVPSETNDSPPSALTAQPLGVRPGNKAADSHRDPLTESVHTAQTELSTAQYPADQDNKLANSSHVLRLHPAPQWSHSTKDAEMQAVDPENGKGLVFEEAESEVKEEAHDRKQAKGSRSRSRRSWIWNQFFVIEEYAGPEPVLIGRLHTDMDRNDGRTKYVLRGEGAGSVFVIDEKTGNIHVTKPLDREEKDEYRLIATATDRQTDRALEPSSQFIIRVQDINDNPPVFDEGPYTATVPEMANIGTGPWCYLINKT
uniref:Cadherin domain-containing protein n=1 Tax=Monopterus albus TaxID=43700 RepID=A0A3Q3JEK7_MONAL